MKKVIIDKNTDKIMLSDIDVERTPIFAKSIYDKKLRGMFVKEASGWILRIGGKCGVHGHFGTIKACMKEAAESGYEFCVDI